MGRGHYLDVRERGAPGLITEVNKHLNDPFPFVDVCLQGQWLILVKHTHACNIQMDALISVHYVYVSPLYSRLFFFITLRSSGHAPKQNWDGKQLRAYT
jgi:hypothetical protein